MPSMDFEDQLKVRNSLKTCMDTHPNIESLEEIANYIELDTGIRPSLTTISRYLSDAGYKKAWVQER